MSEVKDSGATAQYKNDWDKLLAGMGMLANQRTRTFELAELNGLFDPVKAADSSQARISEIEAGLDAAIRAANLALFVVRKQGIMPNDNWSEGFDNDMKIARLARSAPRKDAP